MSRLRDRTKKPCPFCQESGGIMLDRVSMLWVCSCGREWCAINNPHWKAKEADRQEPLT